MNTGDHLAGKRELKRVYNKSHARKVQTWHEHPHHLIRKQDVALTIKFDNGSDFSRIVFICYKDIVDNRHCQKVLVEKRGKTVYLYPISRDYYR